MARTVRVFDKSSDVEVVQREVATVSEPGSVGASINGAVVGIKVRMSSCDHDQGGDCV